MIILIKNISVYVFFINLEFLYLINIKIYIMKKNYFLTIIFTILSFLSVYSQCDHTFVMNDSYGDGWNGASVDILVDGVVVVEAAAAVSAGVTSGSTEDLLFSVQVILMYHLLKIYYFL